MVRLGIGFEGSLRFYTPEECDEWLHTRERLKPDEVPDAQVERVDYPLKPHQVFFVAHWIAQSLTFRMPTLLWLTEWGIWPSSENWHLYYRLRQTYGDQRLLHEAPGHLFLEHESEDLASLLQVAMLNGWGGYILTQADFVTAPSMVCARGSRGAARALGCLLTLGFGRPATSSRTLGTALDIPQTRAPARHGPATRNPCR